METFTDDTVVALASFLSPRDMLNLALTCKRFGDKHGLDKKQSAARGESTREVRQKTENISLMEVVARTVLHTEWTDEERNALPRNGDESWFGIYQDFLKLFHHPLQFDKLVGRSINYVDHSSKDKTRVRSTGSPASTAICSNIMRSGKHYVSFQVNDEDPASNFGITCGVMRPTTKGITKGLTKCNPLHDDLSRFSLKDYEMLYGDNNVDCCLFNTFMGCGLIRERWKKWEDSELLAMNEGRERLLSKMQNQCNPIQWEGQEPSPTTNFKIGLLLDLTKGTLDVYKNDRRLGSMKSGLVGEYCWVVSVASLSDAAQLLVSIGR